MKTKTIETLIDRIFWALVLLLPLIAYVIINHHGSTDLITVLNQFYIDDSNLIYSGLVMMFGSGGYIPFIDTTEVNPLLIYMSYFFLIELVHIIVDVLLFVPRICVKILDKASEVGKL
jgi:hypothetical protein